MLSYRSRSSSPSYTCSISNSGILSQMALPSILLRHPKTRSSAFVQWRSGKVVDVIRHVISSGTSQRTTMVCGDQTVRKPSAGEQRVYFTASIARRSGLRHLFPQEPNTRAHWRRSRRAWTRIACSNHVAEHGSSKGSTDLQVASLGQ